MAGAFEFPAGQFQEPPHLGSGLHSPSRGKNGEPQDSHLPWELEAGGSEI